MRAAARVACLIALVACLSAACSPRPLVRQFEYEEEMYLDVDGSATIVLNASMPALAAMHGLPVPIDPSVRIDRARVRELFESPGVEVTRVSRPWRRQGRRFIQVRMEVADVRRLGARPFAWSTYRLDRRDGLFVFAQTVGPPTGSVPAEAGWTGSELVGFRIHLPSRIVYHNAPSKRIERGNILSWEQPLRDRLAGTPLDIEVRMEPESILFRTLLVFGGAAAAALALLAAAIWLVWRRGRMARATGPGSPGAA
jgi:hypothetical protein